MPDTDDYRACICIYPGGQIRKSCVKHIRIMTPAQAKEALAADHAAYVRPGEESELVEYAKELRNV